jgi:radical SAM protein with 4Fe4S-binding SPASM domain
MGDRMNIMSFLFEVTNRCNNDCSFCYNVWKENSAYPKKELTPNEVKILFDKVLLGIPTASIHLGGGEPLLRDDLEDIVSYFKSKKMGVSVSTNGVLLSEARAKSLVKAGVNRFEVTIVSADRNTHEEMCGNQGCYDKAQEAIVNARKFEVYTCIAFPATKRNIQDVSEVMDLCFALGAQEFGFYRFIPTGRGFINKEELSPGNDQINTALEILDKKAKEYGIKVTVGIPIEPCIIKKKLENMKLSFCTGGLSKFTIDCSGNLRLCEQSPEILGSLFENNFLSLALSKRVKNLVRFTKETCVDCGYKKLCRGGCRYLNRECECGVT